jgi:rubrerythrin
MQTYQQVRDVLKRVKGIYHQLRDYYEDLGDEAKDEKLRLLLDYMSRHEEYIDAALADYEPQAAESTLNTWLQYIPDESLRRTFEEARFEPGMSRDEVIETALRLDQALIELYEFLAESRTVPKVQELFASLVEMERKKNYQYAWATLDDG